MTSHEIGEISLNISTAICFFWFVPQLRLTFSRKSTSGLSLWMHALLITGYVADLVYGFGRHMPLQYQMVTVFGLFSLSITHFQFWRYGLETVSEKKIYYSITLLFFIIFPFAILTITIYHETKLFYDIAGVISNFCWLTFFMPQIIKNYQLKSAEAISFGFIFLAIMSASCDGIAAYTLNYDWPSLIYIPFYLTQRFFILAQALSYRRSYITFAYE